MNARDWFGVIVRTSGLLLVLYSIQLGVALAAMRFNPLLRETQHGIPGLTTPSAMLLGPAITALAALLVGAYLLRGAPGLLAYSYPEPQRDTTPLGVSTAV